MKKKNLSGSIETFQSQTIYLNVNYLEKGEYTLHIIHKNRIIKRTNFTKDK
ncbi:hypothetical protein [Constantimarinum furrinae]|uniref:Uncharacterized protein n=1 Tax=Constantimarinum furrinae TaxID=2562285 RepID=A0A7G8PXJ1_9FLAO|nr:hypothetical protein [Constantimarinum furrinae]QNJ99057.1 hypothetical protein ALE3EI_2522 [Constantimarinum furrinae]